MNYAEGTLTIIFGLLTIIGRKQFRPGNIVLAGLVIVMHGVHVLLPVKP